MTFVLNQLLSRYNVGLKNRVEYKPKAFWCNWWAQRDLNPRPSDYEFENRVEQGVSGSCLQLHSVAVNPMLSMVFDHS